MRRTRTLSALESQLLSKSDIISPRNGLLISKNSWSENNTTKKRRKTTGSLDLKKRFNLRKIFIDFLTTDFDRSLENQKKNMRNASIKLLSYLDKDYDKILEYSYNAIVNIIMLILSNGENELNQQQVKHNIHFYIKLAEKANKELDHQTVILILLALDNYNIQRLNIKLNKYDEKILINLHFRYGNFRNCYNKQVLLFKLNNNIVKDSVPSGLLLQMYSGRSEKVFENYKIFGKHPKKNEFIEINNKIHKIKQFYIDKLKENNKLNLNNIYKKNPKEIDFIKNRLSSQKDKDNLSLFLFNLSLSVKNVEVNKEEYRTEQIMNYYRICYCK